MHIYNSFTGQKQELVPIEPGHVRMYVCGMTVYDYCHIGHARVMVVFDMVVRYLRARGYRVSHVRNITDIDDKIIKRAVENGEAITALTERFIRYMHEDADALGVLRPDQEPRATRSIEDIIAMVETLVSRGFAYPAANGDVYYDVSKFASYGRLSRKRLEDLRAGARVEVDEAKDDPLDFVLWKSAKPGEPADAIWNSPWGPGRPGWHIECSAMSTRCLGEHFDIHGGGMDLMFPHHENEIAQSEAATGCTFVNLWMHNGFVRVNHEKMSKSLGNFFTLRDVLARYHPEVIRYFILASHYRSPLDYADQNLEAAKAAVDRLYTALRGMSGKSDVVDGGAYAERFHAAMEDDFNTPDAIAVLFELARDVNRAKADSRAEEAARLGTVLRQLGNILGILQLNADGYLKSSRASAASQEAGDLSDLRIEEFIAARNAARRAKNWAESDRIRDELKERGVVLEDAAGGTTWRRV